MRTWAILIIVLIACSCKHRETTTTTTTSDTIKTTTVTRADAKDVVTSKWTDQSAYFGVYRFAKDITGIGFEIGDGHAANTIDSLFKNVDIPVSAKNIVDSTGSFDIRYSKELERNIITNDSVKFFYVYCTRGFAKARVSKVLYISTDCSSFLILQLSKIDTALYGQPMIAGKKSIDLLYKKDAALQQQLEAYTKREGEGADYKDSIAPQQFAYNKNIVLTYSDNLQWFVKSNKPGTCQFPDRRVFKRSERLGKPVWMSDLDLFGIPCD